MNYKIVEQVSRKKKSMSGVLRVVMIILQCFLWLWESRFPRHFMLPGFSACRAVFCL